MFTYGLVLIFLGGLFAMAFFGTYWIPWAAHKEMTTRHTHKWDYGTFETFKQEFAKRKWNHEGWPKSLFDYSTKSQIHASIIQFNDKGMVLSWPDYLRFQKFIKTYYKPNANQEKGLWDKKSSLKVVK